ncbi:hypothetical protein [Maioricimonas sp. JC845]|uniref:hypothetical protein n=1 Tax=Maioricimonas sp. JC845 TaxID=3232138 RepID=UPI00345B204E
MSIDVYNLEFPLWTNRIETAGYRFDRVEDYRNQVRLLHQPTSITAEFEIPANTGQHAVTAHLTLPEEEKPALLPWSDPDPTALSDVLLLLSLFTTRHVFCVRHEHNAAPNTVITADPRSFAWGGVLATSLPYVRGEPTEGVSATRVSNRTLESGVNDVVQTIRSDDWRKMYRDGFYLILLRSALSQRNVESAFIECWTIWEHLFSILNDSLMDHRAIQRVSAVEKITFILVTYAVRSELDKSERKRLEDLAEIRNRLVHFGRFPERSHVLDDAMLFIRLTEFVAAKTLGLEPSRIFNTIEKLEAFLERKKQSS